MLTAIYDSNYSYMSFLMICRLLKLGGCLAIFLMRYQASTIMDQLFVRYVTTGSMYPIKFLHHLLS